MVRKFRTKSLQHYVFHIAKIVDKITQIQAPKYVQAYHSRFHKFLDYEFKKFIHNLILHFERCIHVKTFLLNHQYINVYACNVRLKFAEHVVKR